MKKHRTVKLCGVFDSVKRNRLGGGISILCDLVGGWAEDGQIPLDWEMLGDLVSDISYCNVKNLFHI